MIAAEATSAGIAGLGAAKLSGPRPMPAARSLLHKTGWSSVAVASVLVARFGVTVFTARYLGPSGAGRLAYLLWVQEVAATVTGFGLQSCVTRFVAGLAGKGVGGGRELASWLYRIYLVLTVLGAAGICALAPQSWRPAEDGAVRIALGLCLVSQAVGAFYTAYLAGRQEFRRVARLNLWSSGALICGAACGMALWGVPGILLGYAAGSAIPALLSSELLRGGSVERTLAVRCLKYSCFAWFAAIVSACAWSRIEVVFLERMWGNREVALFSAGLTVSALATQGPMLLSTALMPHFAESAGAGLTSAAEFAYARAVRMLAALLFPLCLGMASVIPVLLPAIYGEAFRAAVPTAMVLAAFSALSLMSVSSALVYGSGRAWFVAASGFGGAVLSLAGCATVIPVWGAWGASLSRSAVQTAMAVLGTWYVHRHLGCPAPVKALGKVLAAAFAAALSSFATLQRLPSVAALALAVPLAALVYVAMLRLTRALDAGDAQSLHYAFGRMPKPLAAPAAGLLEWIVR